jgi:hypothetical protein
MADAEEEVQLSLFADTGEALQALEAKDGVYTSERFKKLYPERVDFVLTAYGMGLGPRALIRAYTGTYGQGIHHLTITALVMSEPMKLAKLREEIGKRSLLGSREILAVFQEGMSQMTDEKIAEMGPKEFQHLATAYEKMVNAGNMLTGGSTAHVTVEKKAAAQPDKMIKMADAVEAMYAEDK